MQNILNGNYENNYRKMYMYMYMYAHDYIIWGCSYEKLSYASLEPDLWYVFCTTLVHVKRTLALKRLYAHVHVHHTNLPVLSWRVLVRSLEGPRPVARSWRRWRTTETETAESESTQ